MGEGPELGWKTHEHLTKLDGFTFRNGRYYATGEPVWEKQKRIDQGRRQYAVPASTVAEFEKEEVKMVDARIKRLREKAGLDPNTKIPGDDGEDIPLDVPEEKKENKDKK